MAERERASPAVSVVIPNYNGAAWLAAAVESVLAQTFTDFELLIVDDGSTDGSPELIRALAAGDVRIRPVLSPHIGQVGVRNLGLAQARAPLIAYLDADDTAMPDRLQRQVDFLRQNPAVGLLGTRALGIDAQGRSRPPAPPAEAGLRALRELTDGPNPITHSSVMARTELLRRLGGYRPAFMAAEDYDFWLRVGEAAELAVLPEPLVTCLTHQASFSQRNALRQAFSVRLARLAAASRRAGAADPCAELTEPPDWTKPPPPGAAWARDAALYRWFDAGNAADPPTDWDHAAAEALLEAAPTLSRGDRRLAARAMAARLRSPNAETARAARAMLGRLSRRHLWVVMSGAGEMTAPALRRWTRRD